MTRPASLPPAVRPFVDFVAVLRANGFAVAPDQTTNWLAAIGLLGPSTIDDVRRSAIATLAIPRDRQDAFNALFDALFLGIALPAALPGSDDDAEAHEPRGIETEAETPDDQDDPGDAATTLERLGARGVTASDTDPLRVLARRAADDLPRRRARRTVAAKRGRLMDLRRTLRAASRHDGEILTLPRRIRTQAQRRVVLLIDISGSMKARTDDALTLGHTLVRAADRAEAFTLGTRLTRVTPALRLRDRGRALDRATALIADIDGGTRIGEALGAFLAVPRFAGFARGGAVVVLSDGLERGSPDALIAATRRLARLAWRLDWLSPLPIEGAPETQGLRAILPFLDHLGDGATNASITRHLLTMARAA